MTAWTAHLANTALVAKQRQTATAWQLSSVQELQVFKEVIQTLTYSDYHYQACVLKVILAQLEP